MARFTAAAAAVLLTLAPAAAQPPAAGPVEAKYALSSFAAALVIDPARFDKAAAAAGVPVADLWQVVDLFTGVDPKALEPRKLDRLAILLDPFPAGNVAFIPVVVARFPAGTDARQKRDPVLGGGVTAAKVGTTGYARSTKFKMAGVELAGHAADDRTLVLTIWPVLEAAVKAGAGGADRPLAAALAKADLDHEVVLVVTPAPLVKKLDEITKAGKPEPLYDAIRPALAKTEVVTVTLDLGKETLLRAEFRAADAAGAGTVRDTLTKLLAQAKAAYPDARKGLEKDLPADRAKPLLAVLDAAVNAHTLTTDGRAVVLTVPRPKDLAPKK